MILELYQNADYQSIWITGPIATGIGLTYLVILVEEVAYKDQQTEPKNKDEWRTGLCVVSPDFAGSSKSINALLLKGFDLSKKPTAEDTAAALAESGTRLDLWCNQSTNPDADLETARTKAAEFNEEPGLLGVRFMSHVDGRIGYEWLH